MMTEEEVEQSLEICEELKHYKNQSVPFEPFNDEVLDEIIRIIEEEKRDEHLFPMETASTDDFSYEEQVNKLPEDSIEDKLPEKIKKYHVIIELFRGIGSLILCIILAIIISYGITRYVAHHTQVEGSSMEPNLHDDDQIIVEEVSYYFHEPERYDVIVFPFREGIYYIKRIIGMPNETIQIKEGKIYINGDELIEGFGNAIIKDPGLAATEIKMGEDEYFVLGDNRNASVDSRKSEVGVVRRKDISGRAWLRLYPFESFGILKHS